MRQSQVKDEDVRTTVLLDHERARDGWGVDPLVLLVQDLQCLDSGLLPQDREALRIVVNINIVTKLLRAQREHVSTSQLLDIQNQDSIKHERLHGLLSVCPDPDDSVVHRPCLRRVMEGLHDRRRILRLVHGFR